MKAIYRCVTCQAEFAITPERLLCDACASDNNSRQPLRGVLRVDLQERAQSGWTPLDLLPVDRSHFAPIPVGETPLWRGLLGEKLGFGKLFFKDETRNPTGSLKDRASYLVSAQARMHGIDEIVLASTGNAASSMAGIGAASGLKVTVFLPAAVPKSKLVQILQYGAKVVLVDGNYDKAYTLSTAYAKERGLLSRNTAYNPMTIEGKKTVSLEIFQQLGRVPDYVFVPTGDGVIIAGVYKGFEDLVKLGFAERMPIIIAAQAEGSNAIARALRTNEFVGRPTTSIADSLCVEVPSNGIQAVHFLKTYGGHATEVSDTAIIAAQARLSREAGLFVEPSSATAFAAFLATKDQLDRDASIVILATGHGLKDPEGAMRGVEMPMQTISTLADIAAAPTSE